MKQVDQTQDTEVRPKAKRRNFSAIYKHRILAEADQCQRGELGALLRRAGLYHSHLSKWRAEREASTLRMSVLGWKIPFCSFLAAEYAKCCAFTDV